MADKLSGDNDGNSINSVVLSTPIFYLLLGAAGFGGAGINGSIGPQLERKAITACFDNSQIAIETSAQHGQELIDLKRYVDDSTRHRYTSEDARKDGSKADARDAQQERRLNSIERFIDGHEG